MCVLATSYVSAQGQFLNHATEFLFSKVQLKEDKFMCLHKVVYRNQVPTQKANPARVLSQLRKLQVDDRAITNFVGQLEVFLCSRDTKAVKISIIGDEEVVAPVLPALVDSRVCQTWAQAFASKGLLLNSVNLQMKIKLSASLLIQSFPTTITKDDLISASFIKSLQDSVDKRITDLNLKLKEYRLNVILHKTAAEPNKNVLSLEKLTYIMLNIESLFIRDSKRALRAWDDYYTADLATISRSSVSTNGEAVINFIEKLKKRYDEEKNLPDPDTFELIPPSVYEENKTPEVDVRGDIVEQPEGIKLPTYPKINEPIKPEESTPVKTDDIPIKDLIIEIQRTYNVEKMLLTYNIITAKMRTEIDACNLSLEGAIKRCESFHGLGNCEPISATAANKKCPTGTLRVGCCQCLVECPVEYDSTWNRQVCQIKTERYRVPAISNVQGANTDAIANGLFIERCPAGFSKKGYICFRDCPAGSTRVGDSTCLKDKPIHIGAPFLWSAGDE